MENEIKLVECDEKIEKVDKVEDLERDIRELKEISKDIHTILVEQGERLDKIEDDVTVTTNLTNKALSEVKKATEYKPKILKTLAAGVTGLAVAGPIGWGLGLTGATLGLICSGGAIVGLSTGMN